MSTILLVEDNRDYAATLKSNLVREGYDVHVADNGADGLARVRELSPDLIILDLMLPAMNGYTGTMRMLLRAGADVNGRHHGELPVTPPLVCAIISQQNDAAELLIRAGADPNLCGRAGNKCSPLTASVEPEHLDPHLIDLLISAGANANRADANGLTPLDAAMRSGNAASAAALRAAGGIRSCRPKPSRSGHPS